MIQTTPTASETDSHPDPTDWESQPASVIATARMAQASGVPTVDVGEWTMVELVRCTRGHTVAKKDCTRFVGQLICPLCECRIQGESLADAVQSEVDSEP